MMAKMIKPIEVKVKPHNDSIRPQNVQLVNFSSGCCPLQLLLGTRRRMKAKGLDADEKVDYAKYF